MDQEVVFGTGKNCISFWHLIFISKCLFRRNKYIFTKVTFPCNCRGKLVNAVFVRRLRRLQSFASGWARWWSAPWVLLLESGLSPQKIQIIQVYIATQTNHCLSIQDFIYPTYWLGNQGSIVYWHPSLNNSYQGNLTPDYSRNLV